MVATYYNFSFTRPEMTPDREKVEPRAISQFIMFQEIPDFVSIALFRKAAATGLLRIRFKIEFVGKHFLFSP